MARRRRGHGEETLQRRDGHDALLLELNHQGAAGALPHQHMSKGKERERGAEAEEGGLQQSGETRPFLLFQSLSSRRAAFLPSCLLLPILAQKHRAEQVLSDPIRAPPRPPHCSTHLPPPPPTTPNDYDDTEGRVFLS